MNFLSCLPSVFVIGNEYEILINVCHNGVCAIDIDGKIYYEENSGVLSSEKTYAKIRVPQNELDVAKKYCVIYRKTINRKAYFSKFDEVQKAEFSFKPLLKKDNINIYHIADVHYRFELAKKTSAYFGDDLDLLIVNGDIGEVETEQNYFEVCKFMGEISGGNIPVIFVRGNHDTRGKLAERFTDFFPSNGKNTYYTFEVGCLCGVILDCGEDKPDNHKEYNGVNMFEPFRKRETEFLKKLQPRPDKMTFAISHICPAQTTLKKGDIFDIERDIYNEWNIELARIGTRFMISGHMHKAYLLEKNSPNSLLKHDYPVIVGSACFENSDIWGTAMTISGEKLLVKFTDSNKQVRETYAIELNTGNIIEL